MSYYNTPHFSIYDLLDSLSQRQQQQQQYLHPFYPVYQRQQPYYYFNTPDYEDEVDEEQDEEEELPNDTLYRSLYGNGPYTNAHRNSLQYRRPSRPVQQQPEQQQQRPPIRRQPSLPKQPHPAESVIDLLNSLGANLSYPAEDELPTRKTFNHDTPIESQSTSSSVPQQEKLEPVTRKSALNFHASAPSPKLDPLQISKPQLSKKLPFSPPINVYDKSDKYLLVVSIPGSDRNSFHVDFHPTSHELIVKGEIKNKYQDDDSNEIKVSEQRFGSFERNIRFPTLPRIDDDGIKLIYNNGLLEITIPKILQTEQHPKIKRRIEIEEVEDEELEREARGGL